MKPFNGNSCNKMKHTLLTTNYYYWKEKKSIRAEIDVNPFKINILLLDVEKDNVLHLIAV